MAAHVENTLLPCEFLVNRPPSTAPRVSFDEDTFRSRPQTLILNTDSSIYHVRPQLLSRNCPVFKEMLSGNDAAEISEVTISGSGEDWSFILSLLRGTTR